MQDQDRNYQPFGEALNIEMRLAVDPELRRAILAFIKSRFLACYSATLDDDAPRLVGGFDPRGELVAAFALRDCRDGFFCEHYLDLPLRDSLQEGLGRDVLLEEVVEIAHLCATRPGVLCDIMPAAAAALARLGYRYVVCTATSRLATFFQRKRLTSLVLGEALPDRLTNAERLRWGSYYATRPVVIAGTLDGVPERLAAIQASREQRRREALR